MFDKIALLLNEYSDSDIENRIIQACNQALLDSYPQLRLRWLRIYGKRWSYLYGNQNDISLNSIRIRLNHEYGLCIDNAGLIPADEFEDTINAIKEYFSDEKTI